MAQYPRWPAAENAENLLTTGGASLTQVKKAARRPAVGRASARRCGTLGRGAPRAAFAFRTQETTMTRPPVNDVDTDEPLNNFSQCHAGILRHLDSFGELPALLAPAQRARQVADDFVKFFRAAAFEHHEEEERELFPAVLKDAEPGPERDRVRVMIDALTREHRDIEQQWNVLEPQLKKVAKGQPADVDPQAIARLIEQYQAHARFEELEFLPLSEKILGRNSHHMAALGLSLHMRHQPVFLGHI